MQLRRSENWEIVGLFFISLIFFTFDVRFQEIIGFESRFYLFALEMWRNGPSFFPTTYNQPYPDYPATSTLLIYLFAKILGMNKLAAVLPSAIAASITVVATYLLGGLHSKRWGLFAVFFLILTVIFFKSARSVALDMFPTMITVCCCYLVYSADKLNKSKRIWWTYLFLILGFAFRGPIGLIIPTGVVCIYFLINKNIRNFLIFGIVAFALLLICMGILLGLAEHTGGDAFMQSVLRMEALGRMDEHKQPIYFYLISSFSKYALSFPLAILVFAGVYFTRRDKAKLIDSQFLWQLAGWVLVILIGMSIPGEKKIRYILPMVPALALICAYPFTIPLENKYFNSYRRLVVGGLFFLPSLFILATEFIYFYSQRNSMELPVAFSAIVTVLIILQLLNFWLGYFYLTKRLQLEAYILAVAVLSFVLTYIFMFEPIEIYFDRARDFVVAVENQRLENHAQLIFYKERPDGMAIKYRINMPEPLVPFFIENENELIRFPGPAFFVTSQKDYDTLSATTKAQFNIVANDVVGHVRVVVFSTKSTENKRKGEQ